ncbi:MAG: FAD:protein FMN transferase, partial [Mangrovicoccus sp.]|nr:FAD:protein FMN transferase [Mangrovicoccus sp.]
PDRAPLWSSVTVEADSATLADALSTAACHLDRSAQAGLLDRAPDLRAVTLVDDQGTITTLRRG